MYPSQQSSDEAREKADKLGMKVVYPGEHELQIDIDDEMSYRIFQSQFEMLKNYVPEVSFEEHVSKSGWPRKHITVTVPFKIWGALRIALQASLGSDLKRELLGCTNMIAGNEQPTLFFEPK